MTILPNPLLAFMDHNTTLHKQVTVTYYVTHHEACITYDDHPILCAEGITYLDALWNLWEIWKQSYKKEI